MWQYRLGVSADEKVKKESPEANLTMPQALIVDMFEQHVSKEEPTG